jgi:predicted extracellular nuclease
MFWNVENLFDTVNAPEKEDDEFTPDSYLRWNRRVYTYKLEQVARIIRMEDPVLLGLAEVENYNVLEDLVLFLPGSNKWGIIHREGSDRRGIDTALLFRKDILDTIRVFFYEPSLPSGSVTREFLIVELIFIRGGESFVVSVVHFPSRRGGSARTKTDRLACSRELLTLLRDLFPHEKVLIMGDLNAGPDEEPVQLLRRSFYNLLHPPNNWTYVYRGRCEQLDYLLVSSEFLTGNLKIKPHSGFVSRPPSMQDEFGFPEPFINNRRVYGGASDHFPIVLRLSLHLKDSRDSKALTLFRHSRGYKIISDL